jgi:hypothetical protein
VILAESIERGIVAIMDGSHVQAAATDIRRVSAGTFTFGAFDGQSPGGTKARTVDEATSVYRFDLILGEIETHESSPVSRKANHKIVRLGISIKVWQHLRTEIQEARRRQNRYDMATSMDLAIQALAYPGNLETDGDAFPSFTGIISGCLVGPGGQGDPIKTDPTEDWDERHLTAQIEASALIKVTQETVPST